MSKNPLLIVIIILLSLVIGGLSFYFYNEYKKKQMAIAFAEGLSEGLKNLEKDLEDMSVENNYDTLSTEVDHDSEVNIEPVVENIEADIPTTVEKINPNVPSNIKRAICQIDIAGRTINKGSCNYESYDSGTFAISNFDTVTGRIDSLQEITVEVDGQGSATVFGIDKTNNIKQWGTAKRSTKQKACWEGQLDVDSSDLEQLENGSFKVCAWGK